MRVIFAYGHEVLSICHGCDYTKPAYEDDHSQTIHTTNVKQLKALEESGVSQLLLGMGLVKYETSFVENRIDGEIFATLTEEELSDFHLWTRSAYF